MKKPALAIVFAIIWLLFITVLLCIPGTDLPKFGWDDKIFLDKWVHVFLFMLLVILWGRAYIQRNPGRNVQKTFAIIAIVSFMYGVVMEVVQDNFIPFRSFDVFDILADGLGCIGGYFFILKKILLH